MFRKKAKQPEPSQENPQEVNAPMKHKSLSYSPKTWHPRTKRIAKWGLVGLLLSASVAGLIRANGKEVGQYIQKNPGIITNLPWPLDEGLEALVERSNLTGSTSKAPVSYLFEAEELNVFSPETAYNMGLSISDIRFMQEQLDLDEKDDQFGVQAVNWYVTRYFGVKDIPPSEFVHSIKEMVNQWGVQPSSALLYVEKFEYLYKAADVGNFQEQKIPTDNWLDKCLAAHYSLYSPEESTIFVQHEISRSDIEMLGGRGIPYQIAEQKKIRLDIRKKSALAKALRVPGSYIQERFNQDPNTLPIDIFKNYHEQHTKDPDVLSYAREFRDIYLEKSQKESSTSKK